MINDYRFRIGQENSKSQRISARLALAALIAGFSSVGMYLIFSSTPTEITVFTPIDQGGVAGTVEIPLKLPSASVATTPAASTIGKTEFSADANAGQVLSDASDSPAKQIEAIPASSTQSPEVSESQGSASTSPAAESASVQRVEVVNTNEVIEAGETTGTPAEFSTDELIALIPEDVLADEQTSETADRWLIERVQSGDSMSRIFARMGLSANLLHRILSSGKDAKKIVRIKPGETVRVRLDADDQLRELLLERNKIRSLQVLAEKESFITKTIERHLETRKAQTSGTITSSLYEGAQRAGLSDDLIMELAEIFGWDIDFALEIRAGDHFSLIYEERFLDGDLYDAGPILAAEFVNRGKVFRAIRYEDKEGHSDYFSPDGHSMRKAFLRAPVDFRRISSRFTRARWHPVLGRKRPHKGVDYAAATGTPIKAAGDGKVIFRGRKGGYGKTVIINHANKYTTLYAHMSKYRKSVKKGTRVRQGQIIGYVGKTGLATGPHLHYEFRVSGVHRNPLTVKLPAALPIDKRYKRDFQAKSAPLIAQLDLISKTQLAAAN